jgi:hypothetical protein
MRCRWATASEVGWGASVSRDIDGSFPLTFSFEAVRVALESWSAVFQTAARPSQLPAEQKKPGISRRPARVGFLSIRNRRHKRKGCMISEAIRPESRHRDNFSNLKFARKGTIVPPETCVPRGRWRWPAGCTLGRRRQKAKVRGFFDRPVPRCISLPIHRKFLIPRIFPFLTFGKSLVRISVKLSQCISTEKNDVKPKRVRSKRRSDDFRAWICGTRFRSRLPPPAMPTGAGSMSNCARMQVRVRNYRVPAD